MYIEFFNYLKLLTVLSKARTCFYLQLNNTFTTGFLGRLLDVPHGLVLSAYRKARVGGAWEKEGKSQEQYR